MKNFYSLFSILVNWVIPTFRQVFFLFVFVVVSFSEALGQSNIAPVASNVSVSINKAWGSWQTITSLIGSDAESDVLRYKIVTLPTSGVLSTENTGSAVSLKAGQEVSSAQLYFKANTKENGAIISFTYKVIDAKGLESASTAIYTIYVGISAVPTAVSKITNPIFNLGDQVKVLLEAKGGSVVSYRIKNLPTASQGKLNLQVLDGLLDLPVSTLGYYDLSLVQTEQLVFTPNPTFTGVVSFSYEAGDALSNLRTAAIGKNAKYSDPAIYSIPVTQPSPLPVKLVGFAAVAHKAGVAIAWETASEKDNDYFQVERSTNGTDFIPIGRVEGHGTSHVPVRYTFLDKGFLQGGILYYRLKQVDDNGQSEYSEVEAVKAAKVPSFSLEAYPTPTQDKVVLNLSGSLSGAVTIFLFQSNGRLVLQNTIESGQPLALDLTHQATGVYFAQVQTLTGKATVRVVKK
jgi:hypothetical protein